jgi:hypothetical protein
VGFEEDKGHKRLGGVVFEGLGVLSFCMVFVWLFGVVLVGFEALVRLDCLGAWSASTISISSDGS